MYAKNSVTLEHAHMVNRGVGDNYLNIAKYELRGRKISNRMDELLAIFIQDNAFREQAKLKTYPRSATNPKNQVINNTTTADNIAIAGQKEADSINGNCIPSWHRTTSSRS